MDGNLCARCGSLIDESLGLPSAPAGDTGAREVARKRLGAVERAGSAPETGQPPHHETSASQASRPGVDGGREDEGDPTTHGPQELAGITLRSFLVLQMLAAGEAVRVRDLVEAVDASGFAVAGRASKVISDALRWEIARGRVVRLGRGTYRVNRPIPRTTLRRMKQRVTWARQKPAAPVRSQPLREPRPLVSADGPWRYRLRYALAGPHRPPGNPGTLRPQLDRLRAARTRTASAPTPATLTPRRARPR